MEPVEPRMERDFMSYSSILEDAEDGGKRFGTEIWGVGNRERNGNDSTQSSQRYGERRGAEEKERKRRKEKPPLTPRVGHPPI
jgi:hypothetical protein